jgi:predicted dehydrogenase
VSRARPGHGTLIRWGILGTGAIARLFARDLARLPDARLVAIGSRSVERAEAFGKELGVPHRYGRYADLVEAPDVDVVYVATPASAHRDNMLLCLEAGKALLCEKPFTVDAREAREVVTAARRSGVFVMEAMWTRFLPAMVRLRELLAADIVGDLHYLVADLGAPPDPEPEPRLVRRELGGGALLQRGIYLISLASMLFGRPDRVTSLGDFGAHGVDEQSAVLLGYPGGQLAMLLCSMRARTSREATVVGNTGYIRIHPPVNCPSGLTLSLRPARQGHGGARRATIPGGFEGWLLRYGKGNPLIRRLRERYRALGDRLVHGIRTKVIRPPMVGTGLHYEATEVMRCLQAGRSESHVMPLDESVDIMETVDRVREQWKAAS